MHKAADPHVAELLIRSGADVNARDNVRIALNPIADSFHLYHSLQHDDEYSKPFATSPYKCLRAVCQKYIRIMYSLWMNLIYTEWSNTIALGC